MAKAFTDRAQFEREKETLIKCEDEKGKQRIIQYKGEFEPGLTIYLEYAAGGSLKDLLNDKPHGLPENEVKNWVKPPTPSGLHSSQDVSDIVVDRPTRRWTSCCTCTTTTTSRTATSRRRT